MAGVSGYVTEAGSNVAVRVMLLFRVTVQGPVPGQATPLPLQPVKVEPIEGAAVRVTAVPPVNSAEHVAPQTIPAGLDLTVPLPAPDFVRDNVGFGGMIVNVAIRLVLAVSVKAQGFVVPFAHTPLQPAKVLLVAGVAAIVIAVPEG